MGTDELTTMGTDELTTTGKGTGETCTVPVIAPPPPLELPGATPAPQVIE
jgi:hypothetical protein